MPIQCVCRPKNHGAGKNAGQKYEHENCKPAITRQLIAKEGNKSNDICFFPGLIQCNFIAVYCHFR